MYCPLRPGLCSTLLHSLQIPSAAHDLAQCALGLWLFTVVDFNISIQKRSRNFLATFYIGPPICIVSDRPIILQDFSHPNCSTLFSPKLGNVPGPLGIYR